MARGPRARYLDLNTLPINAEPFVATKWFDGRWYVTFRVWD